MHITISVPLIELLEPLDLDPSERDALDIEASVSRWCTEARAELLARIGETATISVTPFGTLSVSIEDRADRDGRLHVLAAVAETLRDVIADEGSWTAWRVGPLEEEEDARDRVCLTLTEAWRRR